MTTQSKVILGLVGAAAVGVAIGLLIAPETGSDMRKKIGNTTSDWAGRLSDLFSNAKDEVDNVKDKGTKLAADAANKFNNVKESYS